jgi:hypothetical protein
MNWIVVGGAGIFVAFWAFLLVKGKWFINDWPQWARLSSMGAIAAMMFGLIWYMNSEAEKAELVWAAGEAEVAWEQDRFPLRVMHSDKDIADDVIEEAVKAMNRAGCDLFVIVGPGDAWDVLVERGSFGEKSPISGNDLAGSTWKTKDGNQFTIRIHEPGNPTHEFLIVGHELTHVLGLIHDDDPRFITTPGAQAHDDLSKLLPHLSRKDSAALKLKYCR